MIFAVIAAEKATFAVRTLCRVLGVCPSGYYAWAQRAGVSVRQLADQRLRVQLRLLHAESRGTYGSPRLQRALRATGQGVGRNRVMRLMRAEQLAGRPRRRFRRTTVGDPTAPPVPNHLQRRFAVAVPNRVWAADITALPTLQGWLYVAVLLDLCSRRVVGWGHPAHARHRVGGGGLASGTRSPVSAPRLTASLGSRRAVHQHGLSRAPGGRGGPAQHESPAELLGQRARRELLSHAQKRIDGRPGLADPRRRVPCARVVSRLLQHATLALVPQLSKPSGLRGRIRRYRMMLSTRPRKRIKIRTIDQRPSTMDYRPNVVSVSFLPVYVTTLTVVPSVSTDTAPSRSVR